VLLFFSKGHHICSSSTYLSMDLASSYSSLHLSTQDTQHFILVP